MKRHPQAAEKKGFGFLKAISICLVVILLFSQAAFGSSIGWKRKELKQVRKNLRVVRKKLVEANVREKDFSQQLHRTQSQIYTLKLDIKELNKSIIASQQVIQQLRKELEQLQKVHCEKQASLQKRLKEIYLHADNNVLEVLADSQSFSEFANQADFLGRVCQADEKVIKSLRIEQEAIRFKQNQLNKKYKKMLSYRGKLRQKRLSLRAIEERREELLGEVKKERRYYENRKYELEEHTQELENDIQDMIRSYQSRNSSNYGGSHVPAESTGSYGWPTNGVITSEFGWRVHPIYGSSRFHTGIDIGAGHGNAIKAADGGTVILSGWCGGYGNAVIIDHGKGITTLYGHCSSLYVSYGQAVAKGSVIAAVGSTGNSTGPHLHFEVRQNGVPVSPWGYIR